MALNSSSFIIRVEEIPETGISFGLTMNDIRTWLDHHQIQPVDFKTIPRSFGGMGFEITFANQHDARHFQQDIGGRLLIGPPARVCACKA